MIAGAAASEPAFSPAVSIRGIRSLLRAERVGFFCDYAKDPFWLEWAAAQESLRRLFDRSHTGDVITERLARWFTHSFALSNDEDACEKAWTAFAAAGGVLGTIAWNALAHGLHAFGGTRPARVLRAGRVVRLRSPRERLLRHRGVGVPVKRPVRG
jgi:hypothetical protein